MDNKGDNKDMTRQEITEMLVVIYECGICDCYHPWRWNGDCREDSSRISSPEEYAERLGISVYDLEVRSMEERVAADIEEYREGR